MVCDTKAASVICRCAVFSWQKPCVYLYITHLYRILEDFQPTCQIWLLYKRNTLKNECLFLFILGRQGGRCMSEPVEPGDKINVLKLLLGSILYYFPCPSHIQFFKFKGLLTCFKTRDGNAVITESAFPLPVSEDQSKCERLCCPRFHRLCSRCAGAAGITALQATLRVTPGPPSARAETLGCRLSTPAELRLLSPQLPRRCAGVTQGSVRNDVTPSLSFCPARPCCVPGSECAPRTRGGGDWGYPHCRPG